MRVMILTLLILASASDALAQTSIGNEAVAPEHFAKRPGAQAFPRTDAVVRRYIQEKSITGEIDPTEYQQFIQQRNSLREEIKTLGRTGETRAVEEKLSSLRQLQRQQRDYVRDLLSDNPELKQRLRDQRQRVHRRQLDRRRDLIDRRRERIRDRISDRPTRT